SCRKSVSTNQVIVSPYQAISGALAKLGTTAPVTRRYDRRTLGKLAPPGCTPRWIEAADLLLDVVGGRGLPLLGEYDFGALADFDCAVRKRRLDAPSLVIGRHVSGRRIVLASGDGAIYTHDFHERLAGSLSVFLERIAAECYPTPAVY